MVVADWLLSVLYTLSILLFAAFMIRKHSGWALASGLVLGAAILVKPAAEFGIAALLITILIRPRAHWRGLVALIAVAIVMVPWAIRNDNDYHLVTVSPIGTINTYEFTALVALHGPLFWNPTEALQISNHFGGQLYKLHLSPAALDHRMQTEAFHIVIHRLPKTAVQALDGLARTAFGTGRDTLAIATGNRAIPSVVGTGLPLLQIVLYWLLAVVGTAVAWRNRIVPRPVLALLALATIVIILPAASPVANARFRVPAAPLLCVLAGYGLTVLLPAVRPAKVLSRA
jgi:hypothetical protein